MFSSTVLFVIGDIDRYGDGERDGDGDGDGGGW